MIGDNCSSGEDSNGEETFVTPTEAEPSGAAKKPASAD